MIITSKNLNIEHIAESGQCFRMNRIDDTTYYVIAFGRYIELKQIDEDKVDISCSEKDYNQIWKEYFDLEYDYNKIVTSLTKGEDEFLKSAALFGGGLRILKQEPFEALISFIISQNKNIPAIKRSIEKICCKYGDPIYEDKGGKVYYSFPTPERLANAKREELRETGLGYRDEYIIRSSMSIFNGDIDLYQLRNTKYEEAIVELLKLHGVGVKVANCVSLYGLHHIEVFPIDVWIARILKEIYNDNFDLNLYSGYAGIVQQYMFYYMRNGR
jgi:N-glycosylase/DNA lyase